MKKILTLSLAISALVFSASAQEKRQNKKEGERTEGREGRGGMMQDLNLTEAQKTQMKANREAFKAQMDQLKAQNLPDAQFKERMEALRADQRSKMEAILTPEQKTKWAEQRKNFEGKKGNEGKFEGKNDDRQNKHFDKMKEKLGLTDDQATRLKAQHEALKVRREAIKNDKTLSKSARKEKMMALRNEAKEQRKSILTPEQLKKMEEFKKDHKGKGPKKA